MPFTITCTRSGERNEVAEITLVGDLDYEGADRFYETLREQFATPDARPSRIVLQMRELTYLVSKALRVLMAIKQMNSSKAEVIAVAPCEMVLDTLKKARVDRDFLIVDVYPLPS